MLKLNGPLLNADGPCERPEEEDIVNRDLIAFIESKRRSLGLGLSDLAKRYNPRKPHKMRRALDAFRETGKIHPAYMAFLSRELNFHQDEVAELERRHDLRIHRQRNLFVQHFDLIERHADLILATAEYRNITFHGLALGALYIGLHQPMTVGVLLRLYQKGEWICDSSCCGPVHIFFGAGSPLSGMNSFQGFCRGCGRLLYGQMGSFSQLFFPVRKVMEESASCEPSHETVESLIIALLMREGKWAGS